MDPSIALLRDERSLVLKERQAHRRHAREARTESIRSVELVDYLFFLYLVIVLALLGISGRGISSYPRHMTVHLSFLAIGVLLLWLNARGSGRFVFFWRVWYIPFLYVFLFEEVGHMIRPGLSVFFDSWVLLLEAKTFGGYPTVWLQSLATPWLTEVMSSFYMTYYLLIPALGLNLYWHGELVRLNDFILTTSVTFFFCFLHYLLMPVAGPIFLTDGLPFQLVHLSGGPLTVFEQWLFYRGAIQGGAFPSSHVAVAAVVLLFAFRYGKCPYVFTVVVAGLAVSTVYNGYHYGVDVFYGLAIGLAFYLICPFLNKAWRSSRTSHASTHQPS